jgi:hypothetical protein
MIRRMVSPFNIWKAHQQLQYLEENLQVNNTGFFERERTRMILKNKHSSIFLRLNICVGWFFKNQEKE